MNFKKILVYTGLITGGLYASYKFGVKIAEAVAPLTENTIRRSFNIPRIAIPQPIIPIKPNVPTTIKDTNLANNYKYINELGIIVKQKAEGDEIVGFMPYSPFPYSLEENNPINHLWQPFISSVEIQGNVVSAEIADNLLSGNSSKKISTYKCNPVPYYGIQPGQRNNNEFASLGIYGIPYDYTWNDRFGQTIKTGPGYLVCDFDPFFGAPRQDIPEYVTGSANISKHSLILSVAGQDVSNYEQIRNILAEIFNPGDYVHILYKEHYNHPDNLIRNAWVQLGAQRYGEEGIGEFLFANSPKFAIYIASNGNAIYTPMLSDIHYGISYNNDHEQLIGSMTQNTPLVQAADYNNITRLAASEQINTRYTEPISFGGVNQTVPYDIEAVYNTIPKNPLTEYRVSMLTPASRPNIMMPECYYSLADISLNRHGIICMGAANTGEPINMPKPQDGDRLLKIGCFSLDRRSEYNYILSLFNPGDLVVLTVNRNNRILRVIARVTIFIQ